MVLLLLLPLQKKFQFISERNFALVKVPEAPAFPIPTLHTFLQNSFQDSVVSWFNATTGLRPLLVRLRNQIDYSFFHLTHGKVMLGKNDCLFLDENSSAYLGLGMDSVLFIKRMDTIVMLEKFLSAKNIPLLYVAAPGKADCFSACLPNEYVAMKKPFTYYNLLIRELNARHIEHIDLRQYFDVQKNNQHHLLFSKQGLHWSIYGASFGLDTIYKKIAGTLRFEPFLIDLSDDTICISPRFPEDDLAEMVNTVAIPVVDTLAHPNPKCTTASKTVVRKPRVLFVGDSFAYIFGFNNLPEQLFDPASKYWFYMKEEKDLINTTKVGTPLSKTDFSAALTQFDMVIILSTEGRYDYGDYGLYGKLSVKPN